MNHRGSGILLHVTSLPSPYGIGDFGPSARHFADFLHGAGQRYWQILPLNPINPAMGSSPYTNMSAMGTNAMLISPELLGAQGLLAPEFASPPAFNRNAVDYGEVIAYKRELLKKAWELFRGADGLLRAECETFSRENAAWLEDYALFNALREHFGGEPWFRWEAALRDRDAGALEEYREKLADETARIKFYQFMAYRQWSELKGYCNDRGIQIFGDLPIYVDYDSVDVWAHPEIFKLDEAKRPRMVAGVPPDYFSATGQRWGNPVYDWDALRGRRYDWWHRRMEWNLKLFDIVRIDHFRGLVAYWEIPAEEETAVNGKWAEVPVYDFLDSLGRRFFTLPVVAEDLGVITPDVREVMRHYNLPAMKVLLFAFDNDEPMHPYKPHVFEKNCVVYTGTHDNNTVQGWFRGEASDDTRRRLADYLGRGTDGGTVHWDMIRMAMASTADMAIFPMQDVLGLGADCRMNTPATVEGNWRWRLKWELLNDDIAGRLRHLTWVYGR